LVLIRSDEYDILLDAGNGIYKADRYLRDDRPVYLFLSHFHFDHISGFHILPRFRFPEGLRIYGQPGTRMLLDRIITTPYTVPLHELPFDAEVFELAEGEHAIPFTVGCLPLVHPVPCFGYRFVLDGRAVAYCTDTGICDNAVRLGRDADLLITECAYKSGENTSLWPHLTPELAIRIAREAGARRLALTHFDANRYRTMEERRAIAKEHSKNFPDLFVAEDGMSVEL
jgi:ribonuclease BN (tRNA processing enzyme)